MSDFIMIVVGLVASFFFCVAIGFLGYTRMLDDHADFNLKEALVGGVVVWFILIGTLICYIVYELYIKKDKS